MKRLAIQQWEAIHLPFSRTARRSVPACATHQPDPFHPARAGPFEASGSGVPVWLPTLLGTSSTVTGRRHSFGRTRVAVPARSDFRVYLPSLGSRKR